MVASPATSLAFLIVGLVLIHRSMQQRATEAIRAISHTYMTRTISPSFMRQTYPASGDGIGCVIRIPSGGRLCGRVDHAL